MRFLGILLSFSIATILFLLCSRSVLFEQMIFTAIRSEISDERALVSREVRSYLWKNRPLPVSLFTQREIVHLSDVKRLFDLQRDFTATLMAVTILLIVAFRPSAHRLWRIMVSVSRISFWTVLVLAAIIYFNFDLLFSGFHVISFANDFWMLDPAVHILIRIYPPDFFFYFIVWCLVLLELAFGVLWFFSRRLMKANL